VGVGAEPTGGTHEGTLVGVLEPDVLVEGRPLHGGVLAQCALKLHVVLGGVFSEDVGLEDVVSDAFERAQGASFVHFELLTNLVLSMLGGQVFDQVGLLRCLKVAK
jgi:hypothetical protein